MCGEQIQRGSKSNFRLGSPPRVRGTDIEVKRVERLNRITPACAGNRWTESDMVGGRWDHPRVCGEQRGGDPLR